MQYYIQPELTIPVPQRGHFLLSREQEGISAVYVGHVGPCRKLV